MTNTAAAVAAAETKCLELIQKTKYTLIAAEMRRAHNTYRMQRLENEK